MTTYLYDISLENLLMHIRTYAENVVATDHDGKPVVTIVERVVFRILFEFTILILFEGNHHADWFL